MEQEIVTLEAASTTVVPHAIPRFDTDVARFSWKDDSRRRDVTSMIQASQPVIVEGALDHWRAIGRWTPEYLRDTFGEFEFDLDGEPWRMADYAERVLKSTRDEPAPYLRNYPLDMLPPAMRADIGAWPACLGRNWLDSLLLPRSARRVFPELYFGGTGAVFPVLHYDDMHMHAVLMQICGEKEYVAFAPEQTPYMYPRGGIEANKSSVDDPEGADSRRFPLYGNAHGAKFVLRAGEMLFVPSGWWHTVRILSPSIAVSVNYANAKNWRSYATDYRAMLARAHSPAIASAVYMYMSLLETLGF